MPSPEAAVAHGLQPIRTIAEMFEGTVVLAAVSSNISKSLRVSDGAPSSAGVRQCFQAMDEAAGTGLVSFARLTGMNEPLFMDEAARRPLLR
jgi:hypothetical protein